MLYIKKSIAFRTTDSKYVHSRKIREMNARLIKTKTKIARLFCNKKNQIYLFSSLFSGSAWIEFCAVHTCAAWNGHCVMSMTKGCGLYGLTRANWHAYSALSDRHEPKYANRQMLTFTRRGALLERSKSAKMHIRQIVSARPIFVWISSGRFGITMSPTAMRFMLTLDLHRNMNKNPFEYDDRIKIMEIIIYAPVSSLAAVAKLMCNSCSMFICRMRKLNASMNSLLEATKKRKKKRISFSIQNATIDVFWKICLEKTSIVLGELRDFIALVANVPFRWKHGKNQSGSAWRFWVVLKIEIQDEIS